MLQIAKGILKNDEDSNGKIPESYYKYIDPERNNKCWDLAIVRGIIPRK